MKLLPKVIVSLLVLAAAGIGAWFFVQGEQSNKVLAQMNALVRAMDLTDEQEEWVLSRVAAHHETALEGARKPAAGSGRFADLNVYLDRLFERLIDDARDDGRNALAEQLKLERTQVSMDFQGP